MSCDFVALATSGVQHLKPYLPGKPADELERELGLSSVVKLASNENPLGPSARSVAAMKDHLQGVAIYPDSGGFYLKKALSEKFAFTMEQITLGNGSNDVLELIGRAYLKPGDEVVFSEFAFLVYGMVTQATGAKAVVTPAKDWGHDLDAMLAAITDQTRIVFIANPNNPTGTWLTHQQLTTFMDQVPEQVVVVLDEAYTEYVQDPDFADGLSLLQHYSNLVVTRTFSKAYGLAGMRVGFAVSNPQIADVLSRVRQPFNVNNLALVAAEAVLTDEEYLQKTVAVNAQGMQQYEQGLSKLALDWIPSAGNFITVDMKTDATEVYTQLLHKGVIVRPIANYAMPEHLRISIGLPDENKRCLAALNEVVDQL